MEVALDGTTKAAPEGREFEQADMAEFRRAEVRIAETEGASWVARIEFGEQPDAGTVRHEQFDQGAGRSPRRVRCGDHWRGAADRGGEEGGHQRAPRAAGLVSDEGRAVADRAERGTVVVAEGLRRRLLRVMAGDGAPSGAVSGVLAGGGRVRTSFGVGGGDEGSSPCRAN